MLTFTGKNGLDPPVSRKSSGRILYFLLTTRSIASNSAPLHGSDTSASEASPRDRSR